MEETNTANHHDIVIKSTHRISPGAKNKLIALAKQRGMSQDSVIESLIRKARLEK